MSLSLFGTHRAPYYILAPDFRHSSAGVRNLHYLCHTLNELGFEAYIAGASKTSIQLRTPLLEVATMERHFRAGVMPVAVYPEIVSGNPLNLPVVARWLLNVPGHLGGENQYDANDLIFYHLAWCLPKGLTGQQLYLPSVDTRVFNNEDNPFDTQRSGFCRYAHKFLGFGGKIRPEHAEFQSLGHEIKLTPEEIAATLRRSEALYCYERSAIIQEATACGCPVICVPSEYWDIQPLEVTEPGIEIDTGPDALAKAKAEIGNTAQILRDVQACSIEQIRQFAQLTQTHASAKTPSTDRAALLAASNQYWQLPISERLRYVEAFRYFYAKAPELSKAKEDSTLTGIDEQKNSGKVPEPDEFSRSNKWLMARELIDQDVITIDNRIAQWEIRPSFQFILRLKDEINLLADTLDSLNTQIWNDWTFDVFSPNAAPDIIHEIPIIRWHTVEDPQNTHRAINEVCAATTSDWIIELPPGAKLDQLYLWRVADEINRHPETLALFVDDFITDADQVCTQLRLKPGVNPASLISSDMAGPLCVSKQTWFATEGASTSDGSPWFAQLLRISDQFGWKAIRHVADALISYSGRFPSDPNACLLSLFNRMKASGTATEILPATEQSWCIRHPLTSTPSVTIAILSEGQQDLLMRCLNSIASKTTYPCFEILVVASEGEDDPVADACVRHAQETTALEIRTIHGKPSDTHAVRCNAAVGASANDFVLLIREDAVIIQEKWLEELVRTCLQDGVAATSPRLISPGNSMIQNAGSVLGLNGLVGSPHQNIAKLGENGYLDCLQIPRDVSILPVACMLVRSTAYRAAGGMDEENLGDHYAAEDLCLRLRKNGQRLIYQPLSTVVDGGCTPLEIEGDTETRLKTEDAKAKARQCFSKRWLDMGTMDPYWNPNLSLQTVQPGAETDFHPQWQYLPSDAPRILARPITGAQATYRVTSPLKALRKSGMATECVWQMGGNREFSAAEIARLAPNTIIVQHYLYDTHLAALQEWQSLPERPFTVYALDDLITDLDSSNPFRKNFPANSRTRLKYALARCDRLVVTTDFLADAHRNFISDIRVVPNRLEQEIWLPLQSKKRTSRKPRIGWAGGSAHQVDLVLLKEVIEQTRGEADWVFFGMCPEEIRPLLAEFHPLVPLAEYPAKLASLNLDIAVAPLAQIPFNQAKSNLRLLEYGVLGIPVVCSDIDPYRGSPACCVKNTPRSWIKAIRERIHAPDARENSGLDMRRWVHKDYLLENHLEEWLAAHLP